MMRKSTQRSKTAIRKQTKAAKASKPGKAVKSDPLALSKKLLEQVLVSLDDDKAEDVVTIELSGKSTIADYMVVASGNSHRHIGAMAEHLMETMKAAGMRRVSMEGAARAEWILIDGSDVIVHLFRPNVREFYSLEKMWGVDIPRNTKAMGRARKSQ